MHNELYIPPIVPDAHDDMNLINRGIKVLHGDLSVLQDEERDLLVKAENEIKELKHMDHHWLHSGEVSYIFNLVSTNPITTELGMARLVTVLVRNNITMPMAIYPNFGEFVRLYSNLIRAIRNNSQY